MAFTFKNMMKAKGKFKAVENELANPHNAMVVIADMMQRDVLDHFVKMENPKGAWKKWKDPKTGKRVSSRPYGKGGNQLLRDKGRLWLSIQGGGNPHVKKFTARVITNVPYAIYHEKGKGAMRRRFMWLSDGARKKIVSYFPKATIRRAFRTGK